MSISAIVRGLLRVIRRKPAVFLYILILTTALLLLGRLIPLGGMLSGLTTLADASFPDSVVAFAQWITVPDMLFYTVAALFAAALLLSMILSLFFSGALGAFADGMRRTDGFRAKSGMGFWGGYKRFMNLATLLFVFLFAFLLLLFVWTVAATPLAIINRAVEVGALKNSVRNVTIAFTAFAAYFGLLFLRVYFFAFLPALYGRTGRPIRSALSYASGRFFRLAKFFFITDVVLIFLTSLYRFTGGALGVLFLNGLLMALSLLFLLFIVFRCDPENGADAAAGSGKNEAEDEDEDEDEDEAEEYDGADEDDEDDEDAEYDEDSEDADADVYDDGEDDDSYGQ
jgi:hypothetical protein